MCEEPDELVLFVVEVMVVLDPSKRILVDGGALVTVVLLPLLVLVLVTVTGGARKMSLLLKFCSALVMDETGPCRPMKEEIVAL